MHNNAYTKLELPLELLILGSSEAKWNISLSKWKQLWFMIWNIFHYSCTLEKDKTTHADSAGHKIYRSQLIVIWDKSTKLRKSEETEDKCFCCYEIAVQWVSAYVSWTIADGFFSLLSLLIPPDQTTRKLKIFILAFKSHGWLALFTRFCW